MRLTETRQYGEDGNSTIQEGKWTGNTGGLSDTGAEGPNITVKLSLLLASGTQCNSISATAGFTFNFTAELGHVS